MTNLPDIGVAVLREKFNPQNIRHMPAVKFFARLDRKQINITAGAFVTDHHISLWFEGSGIQDYHCLPIDITEIRRVK